MSTKKQQIKPLGDRALVRLIEEKEEAKQTRSGIYIPETADKDASQKRGEVVAVGEGKLNDKGEVVPMRVKKGDEIFFSSGWGDKVVFEDEEYYLVSESSILAVIK